MTALAMVVPGDVRTAVSGGNSYDLQLRAALLGAGTAVELIPVPGAWPTPDAAAEQRLTGVLRRLQSAGPARPVLIDGLLAASCPRPVEEAAAAGARVHVLVHLPLALEPGLERAAAAARDRLERRALRAARSVLVPSRWAAAELRRRHGIEQVTVAAPGVQPAPQAAGSAPPRILQLGTVSPVKNQLVVVAALAELTELDWTARLIGSCTRYPHYAEQVRAAVRRAELRGRVELTGQQSGAALEEHWRAADISVLPSIVETYGMVVTESLARAVPVVVSRGTGAVEALGRDAAGRRPGFAVPPTPAAVAGALRRWLLEPDLRHQLRTAAERRRAMLTGWEQTAQTVLMALR